MEKLFIEAKYKGRIKINKKDVDNLPEKIGLVSTVQFADQIDDVVGQLKDKKLVLGKGRQKYDFQVLGCDVCAAETIKDNVDAFLYIGTGYFHPIAIGLLEKDVYILNPDDGNITKLNKRKIDNYKRRKKGAMLKFLNAKNTGVLISTKPGQKYPLKKLEFLEKKYKDKKFYFFIVDHIDINQFENFQFIDAWVNTACPRLEEDFSLVNISEL